MIPALLGALAPTAGQLLAPPAHSDPHGLLGTWLMILWFFVALAMIIAAMRLERRPELQHDAEAEEVGS